MSGAVRPPAAVFGTDGIRGLANTVLTPELAIDLGRAVGVVLGGPVLVGRDTRRSSGMLSSAFAAGACSVGADVLDASVITTPGLAYLAAQLGVAAAAMVSASHNPFPDNGIKVFGGDGSKLADDAERRIEAYLAAGDYPAPTGAGLGDIRRVPGAAARYIDHLLACGVPLDGLAVTLDCAHGAASRYAPEVFRRLGADVDVIAAEPDGTNINADCGSTHIAGLQAALAGTGRIGFAFDGDADRVLAVDEEGGLVDGDRIVVLSALELAARGALPGRGVVVTVMSNLGLHRALDRAGIRVVETPVGDRYVAEALRTHGFGLGGEQSGHVIFTDAATTGDGILTALRVADVVVSTERRLAELAQQMTPFPQVLVNVPADRGLATHAEVTAAVEEGTRRLGERGRILVRASGTEPLVRVMVEAETPDLANDTADGIADIVRRLERTEREGGTTGTRNE